MPKRKHVARAKLYTYRGVNDPPPTRAHKGKGPYWYLDRPRWDRVQMTRADYVRYVGRLALCGSTPK